MNKASQRDFKSYVEAVDNGDDFSNDLFNFNRNLCCASHRSKVIMNIFW